LETSAKDAVNVEKAFTTLSNEIKSKVQSRKEREFIKRGEEILETAKSLFKKLIRAVTLNLSLIHEVKHDTIKKQANETVGQYEDRINLAALEDLNRNYKDRTDPQDLETNTSTNPFEC
jgi:hypothetical protein